jgi:hypothetical protein
VNDEFLQKLYALLTEYDMSITADHMGEITLETGNKYIGYWSGKIEPEVYHDMQ